MKFISLARLKAATQWQTRFTRGLSQLHHVIHVEDRQWSLADDSKDWTLESHEDRKGALVQHSQLTVTTGNPKDVFSVPKISGKFRT